MLAEGPLQREGQIIHVLAARLKTFHPGCSSFAIARFPLIGAQRLGGSGGLPLGDKQQQAPPASATTGPAGR